MVFVEVLETEVELLLVDTVLLHVLEQAARNVEAMRRIKRGVNFVCVIKK